MSEHEKLIDGLRVHINSLGVACCTCGAKTFQAEWHDANCKVRNLAEASDNLDDVAATISRLTEDVERLRLENSDLYAVLESKRENIRRIDVAMHGEAGAARQASACDLIPLARKLRARAEAAEARVKELEGVLTPFADIADLLDAETEGFSETDQLILMLLDYEAARFPVSAFYKTRSALENKKEGDR